jgi:unsaturated chondroitin disaccharide hydrolase
MDNDWINAAQRDIVRKMAWVSEKSKEKIPYTTIDGVHDNKAVDDLNWWTNGFWGGMMWLMYHETHDARYADIAAYSENLLDKCFDDYVGLHHDVGFMWLLTSVASYRLTGNRCSLTRGLHAANILAGRFNPVGRFIRAWNNEPETGIDRSGWAIIDCMMNIPLLYWAARETGDPRYRQIAMAHADTAMEHFVRPDGSANHIVEFDPCSGVFIKSHGGQGYEVGSSWTRGQAWALYGFALSYINTKNQAYLDTAKRIAHYFISNIPENGIIPVDFKQPPEPALEDSTAAAIAACGLIEIARNVGQAEYGIYYRAAIKLLKTLYNQRCDWTTDSDCILTHCTAAYHDKKHHFSIIYGDYFFMEAIFKLKGDDVFLW